MDWMMAYRALMVLLTFGYLACLLLLGVRWLWRAHGRRRDQRRTEARLREEPSPKYTSEDWAWNATNSANGASSSELSEKPSAPDGRTHGR